MNTNTKGKLIIFACLLLWTGLNNSYANCTYAKVLKGTLIENGNTLNWSTSMEVNNDFFVVERSYNGITFETASRIEGAGDSDTGKNYSFTDINSQSTRTFYRLMQVDYDGQTTFSHIIVLTKGDEDYIFSLNTLSTASTDRYFSFSMDSKVEEVLKYSVMTKMGDILKKGETTVVAGTNSVAVDLYGLEVGRYQFAMKVKNEISVIQIEKVDTNEMPKVNLATKGN